MTRVKTALLLTFMLLAPARAQAQAPSFAIPRPGTRMELPRDHGAHPRFATEWWYVTGHLTPRGRPLDAPSGFQLTFFRVSTGASPIATVPGRFAIPDLYLAHFALVDQRRFGHAERLARPGPGWASPDDLDVGTDGWTLKRLPGRTPETWALSAAAEDGALELELEPARPPTFHGEDGVHRKGSCEACASHYISVTRLRARGTLARHGRTQEVEGEAWFDHEIMSGGLDRGQTGWDWMGLHLSDGSDLMVARVRGSSEEGEQHLGIPPGLRPGPRSLPRAAGSPRGAGPPDRIDGTLVDPARAAPTRLALGSVTLAPVAYWQSPASGGRYPVRQWLEVKQERLALELEPVREDQELITRGTGVTYWEGLMRVTGTRDGKPITGLGYLEMTGYSGAAPLTPGRPGGRR